ncbi:hypothetical protein HNY73_010297 [Argiope bruennichi]|uniref:Uncharacterized protein n=1 Tax=Argiope bruennichi TaxID=94029 RepID=A0A8T0F0I9_ARGBR|nr:hypothetical protein HNY73_010297 [Argiope bruennichi]
MRLLTVIMRANVGTMWRLVHGILDYRKMCGQWVPKMFSNFQKELLMGIALQHMFRYPEHPAFLECIVVGDKRWFHHFEPETKRNSMQWKHATSPYLQKFKAVPSAGKMVLAVFFNGRGPIDRST